MELDRTALVKHHAPTAPTFLQLYNDTIDHRPLIGTQKMREAPSHTVRGIDISRGLSEPEVHVPIFRITCRT